jgi:hypothetical protein
MDATYFQRMLKGFTENIKDCEPASARTKPKWELGEFTSVDDARSFAIANGWRATPQKVQIRGISGGYYVVEPYEKDCGCPGIIAPY